MEVRSQAITAAGEIELDAGNFFMLITTSAAVGVEFFKNSSVIEKATGVEAGYKAAPPRPEDGGPAFDKVKITSATAQTVKWGIARGSGGYDRFSGEVSIIKNTGASDTVDQALANGAVVTIAANAARIALVIYAHPNNSGNLRTGPTAAAARGRILQPGIENIWNVTAAIKVHNDSGASQTFGYAEETA